MSGTFWKPLSGARMSNQPKDRHVVNMRGHVAELWARCALCGWSGPYPAFYMLHRVGGTDRELDYCYLCKKTWCGGKAAVLQHVSELGWDIVY